MRGPNSERDAQREIERFFYCEAWLLDNGRFYEWLDLFTEDARYWMPVRETVQPQERSGALEEDEDLFLSLFDDDKEFLTMRVKRLDTGLAHAEQPRSRTRHLITNVWLEEGNENDVEVMARSSFVVFQGRLDRSEHIFSGEREDKLRKIDGHWKIAARKIALDQTVLPRTLSILF